MQLLVSVRNAVEARVVLAAGCAVLDVKEPAHGSLGAATLDVWQAIAQAMAECNRCSASHSDLSPQLSLALGEVRDWERQRTRPQMPPATRYIKIGLAGLGSSADWPARWMHVRDSFAGARPEAAQWIAVAYVDHRRAESPPLTAVAAAAVETGCHGLLLDTWDKSEGTLWDHVTPTELSALAEQLHAAGLKLAAAGRVRAADFACLSANGVDLVGVRSAACVGFARQAAISATAVAELNEVLTTSAVSTLRFGVRDRRETRSVSEG